ncbi:haloalkane dehalogenase [Kibdelosporangium lantanae]|uniref:Haloalkane dehalogenase n=1 Tax=Kibdelosporangium lantanae TaxID=1497396 RepID=A0ABW3M8E9_9PSEU
MSEIHVLDETIHYLDSGSGTPIVFLHGNPGSSHLWRNVLPRVEGARLLAPDLIGMGRSSRPDIPYLFADHARYLDAWFDALELDDVVLVGHDWGGALAFDWAARHPERVRGVAFLETIVKPLEWSELSPQARQRTETVRSPEGETLIGEDNKLVRLAYTVATNNPLSEDDLAEYLAPYPTFESRRPLLAWARQIPIGGEPLAVVERVEAYDKWLATSADVPKLLLTFENSTKLLITPEITEWCAANIANLEIVACGDAGHHAPEDQPVRIGDEISAWATRQGFTKVG